MQLSEVDDAEAAWPPAATTALGRCEALPLAFIYEDACGIEIDTVNVDDPVRGGYG